jgi:FtsH-binding integral membrane protein
MWVLVFAPLALVFFLSFRIQHMSVAAAQTTFWVYAALVGVSFASLGLVYAHDSIARVFLITAATFGGMSLWGYTTSRDLTGWGSFLFMGLIGIIIASVVNIFLLLHFSFYFSFLQLY